MSPSNGGAKLKFAIQASDSSSEIFVINGDLQLEDRGVGRLTTKPLSPGIYRIKERVGSESRERFEVLHTQDQTVILPPFVFASSAPLEATARTHEYQMDAAYQESQRVHSQIGRGSWIFVFSREWTDQRKRDSSSAPSANPAAGLSIRDSDGNALISMETAGHVNNHVPDPWAACNVEVSPGLYRLSLHQPSGASLEQTVAACPGWQTQVFLLQRDYDASRLADLTGASVLMARGMGFRANDSDSRQTELARLGLTNARKVLSDEVRSMLGGKWENPMLGIYGGHLLLLDPSPDQLLLQTVVGNLRRLLGNEHPDVEALALAADAWRGYRFESLPMLRRSWKLIVDATSDRPDLVPEGSPADKMGESLWGEGPWAVWSEPAPRETSLETFEIALESKMGTELENALQVSLSMLSARSTTQGWSRRPRVGSAFEAIRDMGEVDVSPDAEDVSGSTASPAAPGVNRVDDSQIRFLVGSLGVPRTTVERMIRSMGIEEKTNDGTDSESK